MMVMTTKLDLKKILVVLAAIVGVIVALVLLLQGNDESTPTATAAVSSNDGRVQFLKNFGWEVTTSPKESGQVKIPAESTEVFDRYNALQKSQGYDLSQYAGKTVMRYVYEIKNFPEATEPVYATVLVYKNQVIGGDVTNTAAKGAVQGFQMVTKPATTPQQQATQPVPAETETSAELSE